MRPCMALRLHIMASAALLLFVGRGAVQVTPGASTGTTEPPAAPVSPRPRRQEQPPAKPPKAGTGSTKGNQKREQSSTTKPPATRPLAAKGPDQGDTAAAFRSTMNAHVSLALRYVQTKVAVYDRYYKRFVSFYDLKEMEEVRASVRLANWWNNQMSFDETPHLMDPVPGSRGLLYVVDLRDYRWNSPAWYAVASRDPRFRQPLVYFRDAEILRRELGYYGVKPDPERDNTTPVVSVVSGTWLTRETLESNNSPSYYDLLFAEQRFVLDRYKTYDMRIRYYEDEAWPGGEDPRDGKFYKEGTYRVWYTKARTVQDWKAYKFKDFPKNVNELEEFLGVEANQDRALRARIDIDNGAIVAGGKDDRRNGSIVALQNRLVVVKHGTFGEYMRTFDTTKTAGLKDYSESLIFAGRRFVRGAGAKAESDAGEILFYLPNGGQGGLLINGKGERVEFAVSTIANDTADKNLNIGVRTMGSCITCHAGGGGFVKPRSVHERWIALGIKHKFETPEQANRLQGFFRGLNKRMETPSQQYEQLANETTGPFPKWHPLHENGAAAKPWTGARAADEVRQYRSKIDDMVTPELAAREMGLPLPVLRWVAIRAGIEAPNRKGIVVRRNTRAQELANGDPVPRVTWDTDLILQLNLLVDAYHGDPNFQKLFDTVQVPVP